ncbi:MAG: FtsX-like permease family protein [Oscillospiraceae bacterium]|nr:FtsX-like permease family protein [Oscillospiraceae bacterium]
MKRGFYFKLAWTNLRKNYRFYIPHILTGTGLLACLYIVYTLTVDDRLAQVRGGQYLSLFMAIGTAVMLLLSFVLILYTNSFLMRQRKREYGLYNILGMEKRHVIRILFHESFISGACSIVLGLLLGALLYKLCSLLICQLFHAEIVLGFYFLIFFFLLPSALFFSAFYFTTFLMNCLSVGRMKPVELLASRTVGEKEPRVKWPLVLMGALALAGGYYISITTTSPLAALVLFFAAVFLVILGTYCLFTAGSIFVLKALKKREGYYYNKKHMVPVAGLLYRMKQNAVGLASIAILATGVLVMISTTVSLYSGMQETLSQNYPQQLYVEAAYEDASGRMQEVPFEVTEQLVKEAAAQTDLTVEGTENQSYLAVSYLWENDTLYAKAEYAGEPDLSHVTGFTIMTAAAYENLTGRAVSLGENELALCRISSDTIKTVPLGDLTIHGKTYQVTSELTYFPVQAKSLQGLDTYGIVVSSDKALEELYRAQKLVSGEYASDYTHRLAVRLLSTSELSSKGPAMIKLLSEKLEDYAVLKAGEEARWTASYDSVWEAEENIVGMYGTFLFLGIILGLVCLFATALIIYYKQISEGYEDRERYQIMKKVGMSDGEVKAAIGSQTLLVFSLPLITAGIHTAFAFPIPNRLLHVLLLSRTSLFVLCSLISFGVFALVYVLIYRETAKTYYRIVH